MPQPFDQEEPKARPLSRGESVGSGRLPAVLLIALAIRRGGVDVRVKQIAQALDDAGAEYSVVVLRGSSLHRQLDESGLRTSPISRRRSDPRIIRDIISLASAIGATVIDAHNSQSQFWASAAAVLAAIPHRIATVHSTYRDEHANPIRRLVHESSLRFCRATGFRFVAVSRSVDEYLKDTLKVPTQRILLSRNALDALPTPPEPVNLRSIAGWPADSFVIAVIGRLVELKGHALLLDALVGLLAKSSASVRLAIIGTGSSEAGLRKKVAALGLAEKVHFFGFRDDIPGVLSSTDLLCLPSISEGLPFALLEAARQSVPCLASALPGITEVFDDNETIFFVPPGDSGAIERRLGELLASPERTRAVGKAAARMIAEKMTVDRMTEGLFAFYQAPRS